MEKAEWLKGVTFGDDEQFSRALRSAAIYANADDLDDVLQAAVKVVREPVHWWAIAQAILIGSQARGLVPTEADSILDQIPDDSIAAPGRDEAREVINLVRVGTTAESPD